MSQDQITLAEKEKQVLSRMGWGGGGQSKVRCSSRGREGLFAELSDSCMGGTLCETLSSHTEFVYFSVISQ